MGQIIRIDPLDGLWNLRKLGFTPYNVKIAENPKINPPNETE